MADGIIAPCNVAGGSGMTCHGIRPNVRHIGTGFDLDHITAVDMPFCTSLRNTLCRKNDVMSIFKTSDFSHLGF